MSRERVRVVQQNGAIGFVSFITFFGALVHFLQGADGFWGVVLAIGEAIVWPAIAVFHVLGALGA